ncbi:MAG: VPLPA-CTERM sorting domain-containing protein [Nitrospira sp.]|nr:VPLPA-CTERM sorting domain-containing protein [Nitrospira sp.]
MKFRGIKRIMVAAAVTVATATAGMAGQAQAFEFDHGDLVLAIYGNNTEALYNLGAISTVLADGQSKSLDVSAGLAAAGVGGSPVKYTVYGASFTSDFSLQSVYGGTTFDVSQINPDSLGFSSQFGVTLAQQPFQVFDGNTIAKTDPRSFTSVLNQDGSANLNGTWPVSFQGSLGDVLNIVQGDLPNFGAGPYEIAGIVGRVQLTADGSVLFGNPGPDVAPIPLPAGVVLFGSGLIGLIGIARRSFNQQAA